MIKKLLIIVAIIFAPLLLVQWDWMEFYPSNHLLVKWIIGIVYTFIYTLIALSIRELYLLLEEITQK